MGSYLIRFGNHWLMTDVHLTKVEWIEDRAVASRHSYKWACDFRTDMLRQHKTVKLILERDVEKMATDERHRRLKAAWLYAFEETVRTTYRSTYTSNGMWTSAHMYHNLGHSVAKAAELFGKAMKLEKKQ